MAVLRVGFVLAIAGCYAPEAPECVLACTADSDCIGGQACTTDHLCAASGVTACGAQAVTDGAVSGGDAGSGTTQIDVHLNVNGQGIVTSNHGDTCEATGGPPVNCTFKATAGQPLTLTAVASMGNAFKQWTGECGGQANPCHLTPTATVTTGAKFN